MPGGIALQLHTGMRYIAQKNRPGIASGAVFVFYCALIAASSSFSANSTCINEDCASHKNAED